MFQVYKTTSKGTGKPWRLVEIDTQNKYAQLKEIYIYLYALFNKGITYTCEIIQYPIINGALINVVECNISYKLYIFM